jgi:hypothetical protein
MLHRGTYEQDYVDFSRAEVDAGVARFRALADASGNGAGAALEAFEPAFFNTMVIALDRRFVHRGRGLEGKDGNPLNEVRVLADSLLEHGGVMTASSTIRMPPEKTVLGIAYGDEIQVTEDGFRRLADAFLGEIERRFT